MSNNRTAESVAVYGLSLLEQWLWKVSSPVIILFGTFGNVMTIALLRRMRCRQSAVSMSVYFIALAVSDLIQLYVAVFGYMWLSVMFNAGVFNFHEIMCKGGMFLMYMSALTSPWILVAMTTQRVTSVMWPHRAGLICSTRKSYILLAAIIILSAMVSSNKLYSHSLEHPYLNSSGYCAPANEVLQHLEQTVFPWIELTLASVVPFCLLAIGNVLLVWKVAQSVQTARRMGMVSSAHVSSRQRKASSLTVTLIVTSSAFLCLTLPALVIEIYFRSSVLQAKMIDDHLLSNMMIARAIAAVLFYCNSAVNFYLYCLSGSKFRKELKSMLCRTIR